MERVQDDTLILHLRTPRAQTLRFLAGQHLSLAIAGLPPRSKSIASCPCNAMHLQFHIRRVPGDPFSEYVFTQLKISQTVTVEGPWGNFSLDESSKRPIIFVAYETGFASIKSIIEHAIALELEQPLCTSTGWRTSPATTILITCAAPGSTPWTTSVTRR